MVISKIFPYFCATVYVCTYRIIFMTSQPDNQYAVGADVGGSHVCSSVIDIITGEQVTKPFSTALDSKAGAAEIMAILAENIRTSAGMVPHGHVAGAALAFPGPFDYIHGVSIVNGVGKYERIYGLDIASSLLSRLGGFGIRDFRFLNDASAFALGEYVSGAAAGTHRAVAITLGTGVGSGFVADGHLVEEGDEVPASGWVYHLPFEDGIADEAFSTRWICRRYRELTGKAVSGAKDVADRFHSGEAAAGSPTASSGSGAVAGSNISSVVFLVGVMMHLLGRRRRSDDGLRRGRFQCFRRFQLSARGGDRALRGGRATHARARLPFRQRAPHPRPRRPARWLPRAGGAPRRRL